MKFRMVDRILAWQPRERISGTKTVSFEEYALRDAMGGPSALPESLLLESFFQLGNWLIVLSSDFTQMGMIVRASRIGFDSALGPGECLTMDLAVRSWRADGILFDGVGRAGSRQVAVGEGCLAVPAPLADYASPDDLRVLFSEIHRPANTEPRGGSGDPPRKELGEAPGFAHWSRGGSPDPPREGAGKTP